MPRFVFMEVDVGPRVRGSDVYVVEDIERILSALASAARGYGGAYGAGYINALRDVATSVGAPGDGLGPERGDIDGRCIYVVRD
jgi:hypothetical protein